MRQHTHQDLYQGTGTTIVRKRLSFLSVAVLSVAGLLGTVIVCASALAYRGLGIVDRKADALTDFATEFVKALPEYREALPPALADAIDDERRPDYLENVKVDARLIDADSRGRVRGVVEVTNNGDEIVSLLSIRVVGLDRADEPVWEEATWGATPIQIEHEWRGPLMPGVTRRIPVRMWRNDHASSLSCEVTDLRVWKGRTGGAGAASDPAALTSAQN